MKRIIAFLLTLCMLAIIPASGMADSAASLPRMQIGKAIMFDNLQSVVINSYRFSKTYRHVWANGTKQTTYTADEGEIYLILDVTWGGTYVKYSSDIVDAKAYFNGGDAVCNPFPKNYNASFPDLFTFSDTALPWPVAAYDMVYMFTVPESLQRTGALEIRFRNRDYDELASLVLRAGSTAPTPKATRTPAPTGTPKPSAAPDFSAAAGEPLALVYVAELLRANVSATEDSFALNGYMNLHNGGETNWFTVMLDWRDGNECVSAMCSYAERSYSLYPVNTLEKMKCLLVLLNEYETICSLLPTDVALIYRIVEADGSVSEITAETHETVLAELQTALGLSGASVPAEMLEYAPTAAPTPVVAILTPGPAKKTYTISSTGKARLENYVNKAFSGELAVSDRLTVTLVETGCADQLWRHDANGSSVWYSFDEDKQYIYLMGVLENSTDRTLNVFHDVRLSLEIDGISFSGQTAAVKPGVGGFVDTIAPGDLVYIYYLARIPNHLISSAQGIWRIGYGEDGTFTPEQRNAARADFTYCTTIFEVTCPLGYRNK